MSVSSEQLFEFVKEQSGWTTRETDEGPAPVAPTLSGDDLASALAAVAHRAGDEGNERLNQKALDYQHNPRQYTGPTGVVN